MEVEASLIEIYIMLVFKLWNCSVFICIRKVCCFAFWSPKYQSLVICKTLELIFFLSLLSALNYGATILFRGIYLSPFGACNFYIFSYECGRGTGVSFLDNYIASAFGTTRTLPGTSLIELWGLEPWTDMPRDLQTSQSLKLGNYTVFRSPKPL